MIYLASPYSHPDPLIVDMRYQDVKEATVYFMRQGFAIISPVVHCHELAHDNGLPTDFNFWQTWNEAILRQSLGLWVLMLDGWKESKGVQAEIAFAKKHSISVRYVERELYYAGSDNEYAEFLVQAEPLHEDN